MGFTMTRGQRAPRGHMKYNNRKVQVDEMTFDSRAEYRHWQYLVLRQRAGEITDLQRQVSFELAPAVQIGGRKKPSLRYVADFVYREGGETVVADTKGAVTDVWRIKRHLMKSVHGIDVVEIRA